MFVREHRPAKATVSVAAAQHHQLRSLAGRPTAAGASRLRGELERAIVVKAHEGPQAFVVEFAELSSGYTRTITLATPEAAKWTKGRIPVVTPVGAALPGLACSQPCSWIIDDGRPGVLVILSTADRS